jgi:guanylate kinase
MSKDVFLFFGPARTGKSTLLIRIKSKMGIDEFANHLKLVRDGGGRIITMEDVDVRPGNIACTIVPNFYPDKNLILDLAGFHDINDDNGTVISLLNNTLFSHLTQCKICVIMELTVVTSLNGHIRNYITEMKKLLTEQFYVEGLKSSCFIFTKSDLYSEAVINVSGVNLDDYKDHITGLRIATRELINKFIIDNATINPELTQFAGYMINNFIIVDYRQQDQGSVKKTLNDISNNTTPVNAINMRFDLVNAGNRLGKMCEEKLLEYKKLMIDKQRTLTDFKDKVIRDSDIIKREISLLREQINKTNEEITSLNIKIVKLDDLISNCKIRIDETKNTIQKIMKDKQQLTTQQEEFKKRADNVHMLHISSFRSIMSTGLNRRWKIYAEYIKPYNAIDQLNIVVMSLIDHQANKDRIACCRSIKEFNELKIPFISRNGQRTNQVVDVDVQSKIDDSSEIRTTSDTQHVVLCLIDVKIDDDGNAFMDFFKKQLAQIEVDLVKFQGLLVEYKKTIDESDSSIINMKNKLLCDEEIKISCANKISTLHSHIKEETNMRVTFISEFMNSIRKTIGDDSFTVTEDLSKILFQAKIEVTVFKQIPEVRKSADDLLSYESINHQLIMNKSNEILMS